MEQSGIYSTPENGDGGVVAMTPSSSGRPLYPPILPRVLAPPPRFVLSPSPEKSYSECEFLDIISELLKYGVPKVVKKILSYLPPQDVFRYAHCTCPSVLCACCMSCPCPSEEVVAILL